MSKRFWILDFRFWIVSLVLAYVSATSVAGQIPEPGPARPVSIPAVREASLKNGLTLVVVQKPAVPIVTSQLMVRAGANRESAKKAGLANTTADLLTKGTKTRTAEQIAEQLEFLGANINSGASWRTSTVGVTVTSDKLDPAMEIMSDVILNPSFSQKELDLLKSQSLDELKASLTQPAFLAGYAASVYTFGEHPAGGTAASIESISRSDVAKFYADSYVPSDSVLIFTGDITLQRAVEIAQKYFGKWRDGKRVEYNAVGIDRPAKPSSLPILQKILVVDLPGAGQATVNFYRRIDDISRRADDFYTASVLNSLLGGGYSSRLNQEIRIKRGLSYGAGSSFGWRDATANFSTRTQTKNPSAAEVAELVVAELKRLAESDAVESELNPRRLVLTGGFGRNLETTAGLAGALADLYSFGIPTSELNSYMIKIGSVSPASVKGFASKYLSGGTMIIVGDYSIFKDDLAKRFPSTPIDVVKADELNIESPTLRKSDIP
jgi:zinc protease